MRSGDLKWRVTFQQRRRGGLDSWGQLMSDWVDVITHCPAKIEAITGRERLFAKEVQNEVSHIVTVRYHPAFSDPKDIGTWRIKFENRIFNISYAMILDEQRRYVQMQCGEGINDGR